MLYAINPNITYRFIWIRDINCWHVKSSLVKPWSLAQLLHNLHHHSLTVRLVTCLVRLAQVEPHPLGMFRGDLLHNVQCSLAQSLANGVEEDSVVLQLKQVLAKRSYKFDVTDTDDILETESRVINGLKHAWLGKRHFIVFV